MILKKTILSISVIAMLASCSEGNNEGVGTGIGALSGAIIGSQFGSGNGRLLSAAIGAGVGGYIGNSIGKNMDKRDRRSFDQTTQSTVMNAPVGQVTHWRSNHSDYRGNVVVKNEYNHHGRYCREFQQTISIGGKSQPAYGRACRQPDGSWEVVSN